MNVKQIHNAAKTCWTQLYERQGRPELVGLVPDGLGEGHTTELICRLSPNQVFLRSKLAENLSGNSHGALELYPRVVERLPLGAGLIWDSTYGTLRVYVVRSPVIDGVDCRRLVSGLFGQFRAILTSDGWRCLVELAGGHTCGICLDDWNARE